MKGCECLRRKSSLLSLPEWLNRVHMRWSSFSWLAALFIVGNSLFWLASLNDNYLLRESVGAKDEDVEYFADYFGRVDRPVVVRFDLRNTRPLDCKVLGVSKDCDCFQLVSLPEMLCADGNAEVAAKFGNLSIGTHVRSIVARVRWDDGAEGEIFCERSIAVVNAISCSPSVVPLDDMGRGEVQLRVVHPCSVAYDKVIVTCPSGCKVESQAVLLGDAPLRDLVMQTYQIKFTLKCHDSKCSNVYLQVRGGGDTMQTRVAVHFAEE